MTRYFLIAFAALFIASPAEAHRSYRTAPSVAPKIDVAAIPAYPIEQSTKGYRHTRQIGTRARKAVREASAPIQAEQANPGPRPLDSGVIRSEKTGATARVDSAYQAKFQALLDDFEAHGATVYYMGGRRPGHCSLGSQHPCGWAVDFCQDYRGHVSGARDCNLPRPAEFHALVRAHGLYDGSVWCSTDYGHVQAKDSGGCNNVARGSWGHGRVRLASMTGTVQFASVRHHHHHRIRLAHR